MKINEIVTKLAGPLDENASAGSTSSGAVATSLGAGNGFLNGGPGTIKRIQRPKKKR